MHNLQVAAHKALPIHKQWCGSRWRFRSNPVSDAFPALTSVQRTAEIGLAAIDLDAGVADFRGGLGKEEGAAAEKRENGEGKEGAEERRMHLVH